MQRDFWAFSIILIPIATIPVDLGRVDSAT
jgi:hypothetical protein